MGDAAEAAPGGPPLVSVIVPCYNGERWLRDCLEAVAAQTYRPLELSLWDDASSDGSRAGAEAWRATLEERGVRVVIGGCGEDGEGGEKPPLGCGASKNRAVRQSSGAYLCFQDVDDVMWPDRVASQLELALSLGESHLIGSHLARDPPDAQPRFSGWLNGLTQEQLLSQRFCECPLAMVTWFCAREVHDRMGGFMEGGPGKPEDLDFFYRHLRAGGQVAKVPKPLVTYRYHEDQQSRGVSKELIWDLRVAELQSGLLDGLESFSIWSAGREGKRLYKSLSLANRAKVVAFLDIDAGKLAAGQYYERESGARVPILHWTRAADAQNQPTVLCVKRGLHGGFEENLASLQLVEGQQYWHFN